MLRYVILVTWCCLIHAQATQDSPRIIIVGAGAAGIAAASRLLQNGFNNITVLEAENRIGGRVYTTEFGGYKVDVGGQWVHGEEGNVAFEMAWPLGVIEHSLTNSTEKIYSSSEPGISEETGNNLIEFHNNLMTLEIPEEYANKSAGDFIKLKFDEYFDAHPDITTEERISSTNMFELLNMGLNAADSWYNISPSSDYVPCRGDLEMNWKDKGYSMILDILMKKFPDQAEELPVLNNTILNTEVSNINYNDAGGAVRVITANGAEYTADHVIVTVSIGVLKADYETLFNPPLPKTKVNAIKRLHLGHVVKLYLLYDEPWWEGENRMFLYWTEKDRNEIANDPEKSWMLGLVEMSGVVHKPRLLLCWITGPRVPEMEAVPEDRVFSHMKDLIRRVFSKTHNLTEPTAMLRSQWFTNKHFRGTWSYRTPEFENSDSKSTDLAEPVVTNGKPVVLFAGEASHKTQYSTVQGAIRSGWREADRLKKLYDDQKPPTTTK